MIGTTGTVVFSIGIALVALAIGYEWGKAVGRSQTLEEMMDLDGGDTDR